MWVKFFFFSSMCGSSFFFFYLWVGQVFFFTKTSCSPPLKSNGASLTAREMSHWTISHWTRLHVTLLWQLIIRSVCSLPGNSILGLQSYARAYLCVLMMIRIITITWPCWQFKNSTSTWYFCVKMTSAHLHWWNYHWECCLQVWCCQRKWPYL